MSVISDYLCREEYIDLYRGDYVGKEVKGMTPPIGATASRHLVHQIILTEGVKGEQIMDWYIDAHTDGTTSYTPFLSCTTSLAIAQYYAVKRTSECDVSSTIYKVRVPGNRVIRDVKNIGALGSPNDTELFVYGGISVDEIVAYKLNNRSDTADERSYVKDGVRRLFGTGWCMRDYSNPPEELPQQNEKGMWLLNPYRQSQD